MIGCFVIISILMFAICPATLGSEIAIKFEPNVTREYIEAFAKSYGCRVSKIEGIPNLYTLEFVDEPSQMNRRQLLYHPMRQSIQYHLDKHHGVVWAENQILLKRVKRDLLTEKTLDLSHSKSKSKRHVFRISSPLRMRTNGPDNSPMFSPNSQQSDEEFIARLKMALLFPDGQKFGFNSASQTLPENGADASIQSSKQKFTTDQINKIISLLSRLAPKKDWFSILFGASSQPLANQKDLIKQPLPPPEQFNDELLPVQWYLVPLANGVNRALTKASMQVADAWRMGFTGKGVVVAVIDDGLEWNHTDLSSNYDPLASLDINGRDSDPMPSYSGDNAHGTRCGGEIAMVANNRKCGVGIAFNSHIGGIRLLDGSVVDAKEAEALAFGRDHIHIYSSSWGPNDDGETVDGPKSLAKEALERGVNHGRQGKGSIYVWASGNGGKKGDNCNCDGYVGSIYTLAVGSVGQQGKFPWYGERCSAVMAVTYSSNSNLELKIATTDLKNRCTTEHTGTSAAAPIAAGIIALVLEANPSLTWRDVQHLIAWTSDFSPIKNNFGWLRNGVGLMYSDRFGFGLMNAHSLVEAALNWKTVPSKSVCSQSALSGMLPRLIEGVGARVFFETSACRGTDREINFLEHVQVTLSISFPVRGDLEIFLISPSRSVSVMLTPRPNDESGAGFSNWNFTSVNFWGESPAGIWTLIVRDKNLSFRQGHIMTAILHLHGTAQKPFHMQINPSRVYADEILIPEVIDKELINDVQLSVDINNDVAEV